MLEANEMKGLRKIVGKTKKNKNGIRNQQIRESCGSQPINEWVERRRRRYDEHVTRMDAEKAVKISRDNICYYWKNCPKIFSRFSSFLCLFFKFY